MEQQPSALIVGAGFSGATVARELAQAGHRVTVIDQRDHIAGNAYDEVNADAIRVHRYGPHIFHTDNETVFNYLSQFTEWIEYRHRVQAMLSDGTCVPFPPTADMIQEWGSERIVDTFYRPYTRKMWGAEIEDLNPDILARTAAREDNCLDYFPRDRFQYLPVAGYTQLVHRMLSHPNITVKLNTPFDRAMEQDYDHVFASMPIDQYYDFCHGELPYRSIKFTTVTLPVPRVFDVSVVSFTHHGPNTRVTEWKNFPGHGHNICATTLTYEQPCDYRSNNNERYYPVKDASGRNRELYKKYASIDNPRVTFIGRCGLYAYLDMHQAVQTSLTIVRDYLTMLEQNKEQDTMRRS